MIYTSYFANLKNIPDNIIPIAICAKSPEDYHGLEYKRLAPKYWFFKEWKGNHDNDFYNRYFDSEVLGVLNVDRVVEELYTLAGKKEHEEVDVCLVCYEKDTFCHRHRVAEWLTKSGYITEELPHR